MRYYFFAATFNVGSALCSSNFGCYLQGFPSFDHLHGIVLKRKPEAKDLLILSICELSEADYKYLFGL